MAKDIRPLPICDARYVIACGPCWLKRNGEGEVRRLLDQCLPVEFDVRDLLVKMEKILDFEVYLEDYEGSIVPERLSKAGFNWLFKICADREKCSLRSFGGLVVKMLKELECVRYYDLESMAPPTKEHTELDSWDHEEYSDCPALATHLIHYYVTGCSPEVAASLIAESPKISRSDIDTALRTPYTVCVGRK